MSIPSNFSLRQVEPVFMRPRLGILSIYARNIPDHFRLNKSYPGRKLLLIREASPENGKNKQMELCEIEDFH